MGIGLFYGPNFLSFGVSKCYSKVKKDETGISQRCRSAKKL